MSNLKILLLVVVAVIAATAISFAQSYTLSPNDTVVVNGVFEDLQTLSILQVNTTSDTLYLKWEKVSESVPPNWDVSICDNSICNTSLVDSGTMNPVYPGDYGLLLIHCTPHLNYGTATIRYAVWEVTNPSSKDTLTFIINANPTGIETINAIEPSLWFTQNKIHLKNNSENFSSLCLVNLNGKEIFKTTINNKTEFDLPPFPLSLYIIQLRGKGKQFQQKIFLNNQ